MYGFAQIKVNDLNAPVNPLGLTIGTVGFKTVPGQPVEITAVPEPASLTLVGIGGIGLLPVRRWRKRNHTFRLPPPTPALRKKLTAVRGSPGFSARLGSGSG